MNTWGWIFMLTSLVAVWGATIWAYRRLLSAPPHKPDPEHTRADPLLSHEREAD